MNALDLLRRRIVTPDDLTRLAVEANRLQFLSLAVERCGENALVPEARRGMAGREGGFPEEVGVRAEVDRWMRVLGDAGAIWPAELRPCRRRAGKYAGGGEQNDGQCGSYNLHLSSSTEKYISGTSTSSLNSIKRI